MTSSHADPDVLAQPDWQLGLFGALRLSRDGERLCLRGRERRVVAVLALRGPMTRSELAGTLWPEVSEERARTSVRSTLWSLSHTAPGLVVADDEVMLAPTVRLDTTDLLTTWRAVVGGLDAGPRPGPMPPEDLLTGGRCAQPLLADFCDDWAVVERERFEQLRLHLLEGLGARAVAHDELTLAEMLALQAVAIDPLRESAQRRLMEVYLAAGDLAAAIAVHRGFCDLLDRELGLTPSPRMTDLLTAVLSDRLVSPRRPVSAASGDAGARTPRGAAPREGAGPIRPSEPGTLSISHREGIASTAWP